MLEAAGVIFKRDKSLFEHLVGRYAGPKYREFPAEIRTVGNYATGARLSETNLIVLLHFRIATPHLSSGSVGSLFSGKTSPIHGWYRGGSGIKKMVRPGSGCGHPVMCATSC